MQNLQQFVFTGPHTPQHPTKGQPCAAAHKCREGRRKLLCQCGLEVLRATSSQKLWNNGPLPSGPQAAMQRGLTHREESHLGGTVRLIGGEIGTQGNASL